MTDSSLGGARVLVTGATGFLGGRLVEYLVRDRGADVRALTTSYSNASRIARFPVELVQGDITRPDDVRAAVRGCDVVFHCAYGSRGSDARKREVTVGGTRNVIEAARSEGVTRLVHASTMIVYGNAVDGPLDESAPRVRTGSVYGDTKLDAEELVLDAARRGLPATVVQPTAIYGPFAPSWTVNAIETMRTSRTILVDCGNGLSNPVYVDDVVAAMLLAATREAAVGEAFLVSGGERVTWREFYRRLETMAGVEGTVEMSRAQAEAHHAAATRRPAFAPELVRILREHPEVRRRLLKTSLLSTMVRIGRPLLGPLRRALASGDREERAGSRGSPTAREGGRPVKPMSPSQIDFFLARTDVRIDKARERLGYEPAYTFAEGMELTERWARWANLVPFDGA